MAKPGLVAWVERSLLRKIVLGAVAVGFAVGLPLGFADAYLGVRGEVAAEQDSARALAAGLAAGIEAGLAAGEEPATVLGVPALSDALQTRDIVRVDLFDGEGTLIVAAPYAPSAGAEDASGETPPVGSRGSSFIVYTDQPADGRRTAAPSLTDFFFSNRRFAHEVWVPLSDGAGGQPGTLRVIGRADELRKNVVVGVAEHVTIIGAAGLIGLVLIGVGLFPLLYLPISRLDSTARRISAGERDLRMPVTSADEIGRLGRSINDMTDAIVDYQGMANTDVLTGLHNHRFAQASLERLFEEMSPRAPLSVLMMDLDSFKHLNDSFGHVTGDAALRAVAEALRAACGDGDIVCRYGGDEFMVIMRGRDGDSAQEVADRINEELAARVILTEAGTELRLSASVGIAVSPRDATDPHTLVALADAAMYQSKRHGGHGTRMADVAQQAFLAAQATRFAELERLVDEVDLIDGRTRHQSQTAAGVALDLATAAGLSDDAARSLRIAGLLHDVGKSELPADLLVPNRELSPEEESALRSHVEIGERMIEAMPRLDEVLQGVANHHEHFDGSGYPRGLAGADIPILGRIMAIAAGYAERRARGLSAEEAVARVEAEAGRLYDPELVAHLSDVLVGEQDAAA